MKKVLIVTYYWPPSGGPGVQRVLKFAKYLPDYGWEPIIFTVKNGEYPALDPSLEKEISPDLKVYKVKTIEFYQFFRSLTGKGRHEKIETYELLKKKDHLTWKNRLAQFIRLNLFIPDARLGWQFTGMSKAREIIRMEKPDLLFSSSPPHSLQLLARKIAKNNKIKWVADFRDPWTKSFYDKGSSRMGWAEKRNARLEKQGVEGANAIVSVSQGVLDLLPTKKHQLAKAIPNGYDAPDFNVTKSSSEKFRLIYTGHVAQTQNPQNLWKALNKLPESDLSRLEVHFYGSVDPTVMQSILEYSLSEVVSFHSYIPHEEVVKIMTNADLLLLLIPQANSRGILTGKMFEYLATGNRILGVGDSRGAAAEVLNECQAGEMIDFEADPLPFLQKCLNSWREGNAPIPNQTAVTRYSRRNLTKQLADLFDEVCA